MNDATQITSNDYGIQIESLEGMVSAYNNDSLLASSSNAKVMYETRLPPTVYFPRSDLRIDASAISDLNTFCPFKGTASYNHVVIDGRKITSGCWYYENALPEAKAVEDHVAFMPGIATRLDLGSNVLTKNHERNISGPVVDWILREAWQFKTPQELTRAIAKKLNEDGVTISRLSVMIWSLHPLIAGKNYIWSKDKDEVQEISPTYDIHSHPAYVNSPLRHVSKGLGGVRQRLNEKETEFSFPIMEDLKAGGATDYVAMPLPFSNGQTNVLTLTCDHPAGFTTANLGLVFEISSVISRYYEVFNQRENSEALLETYLGKRTGARVLSGEIRRGDGDEIDAAILFCDLRDSTRLEEKLGRDKYLELLNNFFEQTTEIINRNGGEVLKFIGDAVLAIFPVTTAKHEVCKQAQQSATGIIERFDDSTGTSPHRDIDCAIGVAFGEVTYGNVGSNERLDFTVIGRAANIAARLAELGKKEGHKVVVTQSIAAGYKNPIRMGSYKLRNVSDDIDCYALV